ncbi:hypothetical protein [Micromonospora sp. WMMD980]|uniref:hypothetical protein n=1 Tax=Micromonospora sp. WMMD980 TaxID=3016088 RepID=UPI002418120A|nr:hypothetical protein [Micromonospora sp. WMMD980]MDG4799436.1 hypothetical protein [Micromonospora sp. WMMD980]
MTDEFQLERYRYILRQIETTNQNTYRFLALYQTIATALATASVALFLGYKSWGIEQSVAHTGLTALLLLLIVTAAFAVLLILAGVFSWMDYRREECKLVNSILGEGFRSPPRWRSLIRWYETWIVAFIVASMSTMWFLVVHFLMPALGPVS